MHALTVRKSNLALVAYLGLAFVVFALLVRPSLEGASGLRVTADSQMYVELMTALLTNPAQLISVAGNYLGPFLILRLAGSDPVTVALLNCGLFLLSYRVMVRTFDLDRRRFVALLCVNPMVVISLLSVNKEILAFASAAFAAGALASGRRWQMAAALALSILARWQMTLVLLVLLLVRSRLNPFVRHRGVTLALAVALVSVLYPAVLRPVLAPALETHFTATQSASTAGLTELFAAVQDHYGYFLVLVPKLIFSYFGNVFRMLDYVVRPDRLDYADVYNNVVVLGHQLCMVYVCFLALRKRRLTLASENVYFAAVYSVVFGISVLISYRYFFPVYLLLCIELCRRAAGRGPGAAPRTPSPSASGDGPRSAVLFDSAADRGDPMPALRPS
jgi:hypothetical protein